MSKWIYNGKKFTQELVEDYYGFVYNITNNITGKQYIGRKYFISSITKPPLKGYKRKRKIKKTSNWEKYNSSSKYLLSDIEEYGENNFNFEIISLHKNKMELNYMETKAHFHFNVLEALDENGNRLFLNENIERKYYFNAKENDNRLLLSEKLSEKLSD